MLDEEVLKTKQVLKSQLPTEVAIKEQNKERLYTFAVTREQDEGQSSIVPRNDAPVLREDYEPEVDGCGAEAMNYLLNEGDFANDP